MILKGNHIQLELLTAAHRNSLCEIAQDPTIWTYNRTQPLGDQFNYWFDNALKDYQTKQLPFIVRNQQDQRIVGSTRLYDINNEHRRLAIGYTWYIPEVWGSAVNPEAKYLLLGFAFEEWQMNRVEFITDVRNARSRAAIKKLGAQEEGVMRQHMVLDSGLIRDSIIFSIIKPEWDTVKNALKTRLKRFA